MNRRSFLAAAAAALTGAALDPERLLWVPGQKTYFDIQPPPLPTGWVRADKSHMLMRGDVIQIQGYYAVNPMTYKELPYLQSYIVTEDGLNGVVKLHPAHLAPKMTKRPVDLKVFGMQ